MKLPQIRAELKSRIAKGLNFGIEGVEDVLDADSILFNDFILLKSQYNDLMYISANNTLSYDQIELGLNRLRKNLLELVDRLESDHLKKKTVDKALSVQALPTRRANFFKLMDIHFQNLQSIEYAEIYSDGLKEICHGREAIYNIYSALRRRLKHQTDDAEIMKFFYEYFTYDKGPIEVYLKNVRHLIAYSLESEVERPFFLNTLQSLFSRYELAFFFYHARSGADPDFDQLMKASKLIDHSIKDILVRDHHWETDKK